MSFKYRYILSRKITKQSDSTLLVCMLNPSTADDEVDDPTIASVCRLARKNGFSRILVLNLFALRATKPQDMWTHEAPIGPDNWDTWRKVLGELDPTKDIVALAWGRSQKGSHKKRFTEALIQASHQLKKWDGKIMTWVMNADGSPRHPLYIKTDTNLQKYSLEQYLEQLNCRNLQA